MTLFFAFPDMLLTPLFNLLPCLQHLPSSGQNQEFHRQTADALKSLYSYS